MPRAHLCFTIPAAATLLGLAVLIGLGVTGWPGEVGAAGRDFCEATRPGPVMQPANTYSNAGFLLVGLAIGWQAWRDVGARKTPDWNNPIVTTVRYPVGYALCSIGIGLGSTALHASMTPWGGTLDLLAMHLWGAWCIAFATTRLARGGDRLFLALFTAQIGALLSRLVMGNPYSIRGSDLFGAMIATAIAIELVGRWRNRRRQRIDANYLLWAIVTFLAAYACSRVSTSAGPWCDPDSFWQGHAAWHLLCAGSTAFVYLYGRSERLLVGSGR
ncbi:Ceramidase [Planctomycetes bacterium MalM25]|nr:Ceramidase [Planctomycetes bacterium MalM25]